MFLIDKSVHYLSPDDTQFSENVEESTILAEAEYVFVQFYFQIHGR
jgi:hypothetical protein